MLFLQAKWRMVTSQTVRHTKEETSPTHGQRRTGQTRTTTTDTSKKECHLHSETTGQGNEACQQHLPASLADWPGQPIDAARGRSQGLWDSLTQAAFQHSGQNMSPTTGNR